MNPYASGENKFKYRTDRNPPVGPEDPGETEDDFIWVDTVQQIPVVLGDNDSPTLVPEVQHFLTRQQIADPEFTDKLLSGDEEALQLFSGETGYNFYDVIFITFKEEYYSLYETRIEGPIRYQYYRIIEPSNESDVIATEIIVSTMDTNDVSYGDPRYNDIFKYVINRYRSVSEYQIDDVT